MNKIKIKFQATVYVDRLPLSEKDRNKLYALTDTDQLFSEEFDYLRDIIEENALNDPNMSIDWE